MRLFCWIWGSCWQLNTTGRDPLVVRTLCGGRSNRGSNPGHVIFILSRRGIWKLTKGEFHSTRVVAFHQHNVNLVKHYKKMYASAGNRTRINCLEGSYADHYTTDAGSNYIGQFLEGIKKPAMGTHSVNVFFCLHIISNTCSTGTYSANFLLRLV